MEDTLQIFESTKMYYILREISNLLGLKNSLDDFLKSSPFWIADEKSYSCFLMVLENEYDSLLCRKITRNGTSYTRYIVDDIISMLIEHIPDDKVESNINNRCVICLHNRSTIKLKCNHIPKFFEFKKCFNVMTNRNIKTCPLCRQSI